VTELIGHRISFPISQYVLFFQEYLEPGLEEVLQRKFTDLVSEEAYKNIGRVEILFENYFSPEEYNEDFKRLHTRWLEVAMSLPKIYGAAGASWKFFMIITATELVRQMLTKEQKEVDKSDIALMSLKDNFRLLRSS
jgi:hypothetical protein